jgi:chromosomal replication initiator protein
VSNNFDIQSFWDKTLVQLEKRIGSQPFDIWIKPINIISVEDDCVALQVPNRYYSEWVKENHNEDILHELRLTSLSFQIAPIKSITYSFDNVQTLPEPVSYGNESKAKPKSGNRRSDQLANSHRLDSKMTFGNFVIGACNQFAHAASLAVSEFPGSNYNPLYIYGCTGLGKTHLTQAIANQLIAQDPSCRVRYTTSESWVNEMINALRFKKMDEFRARFRDEIDILLVDDIQFISGKDRSQAEFFHTMEVLKSSGRQIIVTSDVLPREIDKLEPRLRTRFEGGLLADIQPPDHETMIAILRKKCDLLNIEVPSDLENWIATRVRGNVRELEGALNRLAALSSFLSSPITIEFAQKHLSNLYIEEREPITVDKVMLATARLYGIRVGDMKASRKMKEVAFPRQVAMYLARKHTNLSFPDLGRAFVRDNSTVQYGCKKIDKQQKTDPDLRHTIQTIEKNLDIENDSQS